MSETSAKSAPLIFQARSIRVQVFVFLRWLKNRIRFHLHVASKSFGRQCWSVQVHPPPCRRGHHFPHSSQTSYVNWFEQKKKLKPSPSACGCEIWTRRKPRRSSLASQLQTVPSAGSFRGSIFVNRGKTEPTPIAFCLKSFRNKVKWLQWRKNEAPLCRASVDCGGASCWPHAYTDRFAGRYAGGRESASQRSNRGGSQRRDCAGKARTEISVSLQGKELRRRIAAVQAYGREEGPHQARTPWAARWTLPRGDQGQAIRIRTLIKRWTANEIVDRYVYTTVQDEATADDDCCCWEGQSTTDSVQAAENGKHIWPEFEKQRTDTINIWFW